MLQKISLILAGKIGAQLPCRRSKSVSWCTKLTAAILLIFIGTLLFFISPYRCSQRRPIWPTSIPACNQSNIFIQDKEELPTTFRNQSPILLWQTKLKPIFKCPKRCCLQNKLFVPSIQLFLPSGFLDFPLLEGCWTHFILIQIVKIISLDWSKDTFFEERYVFWRKTSIKEWNSGGN